MDKEKVIRITLPKYEVDDYFYVRTNYRFKDEASLLSNRHSLISLLETLYWDLDFNKSLYEVNVKPDTLKDFKNQLYIVLESLKGEL